MRFTKIFVLVGLAALIIAPAALALRFTDDSYISRFPTSTSSWLAPFRRASRSLQAA